MSWKILNNRIAYTDGHNLVYPSASDIFSLNQQSHASASFLQEATPPSDELQIRFSRLSALLKIILDFNSLSGKITLRLVALKRGIEHPIQFNNGKLQDSIIIDDVWYSLSPSCECILEVLTASEICEDGPVSLAQYINLKRSLTKNGHIEYADNALGYLSNHPVKESIEPSVSIVNAKLYPYQQHGFQWMRFIADSHCGCILGDQMGLGKTLQVITLLTDRKSAGYGPSLVIAPASLLENWKREFKKFTTGMNVYIHHGPFRTGLYTELKKYDIVITSYGTTVSDLSMLKMISWDTLVIDEAQNIKNPSALRTRIIKSLSRSVAIAVTGTPLENHLSDIWSIMDFIIPGALGTLSDFQAEFPDDIDGAKLLEPLVTPFMIRRRVAEVAQDLPARVDIPQVISLSSDEINMYEALRSRILENYSGQKATLPMLQKLRMFCTHPELIDSSSPADPAAVSKKYERLCELLEEIIALKEKVILFTSYNGMFEILSRDIPERFDIPVFSINGSIPAEHRQPILDQFAHTNGSALLVLNPRAAGTGLNITAASRVIHYNLEWNPALEDQASARAYRRGQTNTVFIYRLFYKDTVEEVINERLEIKRKMFGAAVHGVDGTDENSEDIMRALMIRPGGIRNEQ